jgi:hypothetical protein
LLEVVDALHPPRGLASGLHRGEQQGDQDADDGNHDQKLNQGKAAAMLGHGGSRKVQGVRLSLSHKNE